MPLPLPRVVADVGPGGPGVSGMNAINSLGLNMLKKKFYQPDIESQINSRNALTEGYKIANQYAPERMQLANALAALTNQYYGPNMESQIGNRNAMTQKYNTMTPLEAKELELKNQYYPEVTQGNLNSQKALADYRKTGGVGAGVDQKQLMAFKNQLALDNPGWNEEQLNQAANSYLSGENTLPDGEELPPLQGQAKQHFDSLAKRKTTSALHTGGVKAKQAEAELEVLNKYANEGLKPYGTTYFDKSPEQLLDTFKSDDASQKKLGKFIASQALQFEIAQNRIKLANGQPGVTSTQELMALSKQVIKSKYPRLTGAAREEATRFMDEALKKGLEARNSVDVGASSLGKKPKNEIKIPKGAMRYNEDTDEFEEVHQ